MLGRAPQPPYTPEGWRAQSVEARRLIAVRGLRAVAQGALAVDFVLYLDALHWSGAAIGILLTAQGLVGAALMMAIGPLSDRVGRRVPLIVYETLTVAGAGLVVLDPSAWALAAAAIALGFGRGANGSAGPFSPAEQAWLAGATRPESRSQVFSLNSAASFWGMGLGALAAGAIPHLMRGVGPRIAFLPVFVLAAVVAATNVWQLIRLRERRPERGQKKVISDVRQRVRRQEMRSLWQLVGVNAVNAAGIGLTSPLLPYFFALRFGVGPQAVGPVYGLSFILTGLASLATGELSSRFGLVRTVVWVRSVGVLCMAALPFMPSFGLAALLFVVRSVLSRGTAGVRQAFGVSLVGDDRRGMASSLTNLSMRVPNALGPIFAGELFASGVLTLPFVLAAGFQGLYLVLFGRLFKGRDIPPEEGETGSGPGNLRGEETEGG